VKVLKAFDGIVEQATENELSNASARADRTGMYCCPQTGVALAVLEKLLASKIILSNQCVIVISTAHGLKFSRFKVDYHEKKLQDVTPKYANPPIELPADIKSVRSAINRVIGK
jgi:threonine synthase